MFPQSSEAIAHGACALSPVALSWHSPRKKDTLFTYLAQLFSCLAHDDAGETPFFLKK